MASSLGYAMMNWTSEFARHAKAKRIKKKHSKNNENSDTKEQIQHAISLNDLKQKCSKLGPAIEKNTNETNEIEIQTDGK